VTYDATITFYNVAPTGEISLLHVGDVESPFIPLPHNKLLLDLSEDRERIDILIEKISQMWSKTGQSPLRQKFANQVCTGAALTACTKILEHNGKSHTD
jgi:hypothetical protein